MSDELLKRADALALHTYWAQTPIANVVIDLAARIRELKADLDAARADLLEAQQIIGRATITAYNHYAVLASVKQELATCKGLLREADGALRYHVDQTRPIQRTSDVLAKLDAYFKEPRT